MRKLKLQVQMTLDGFIAGPAGEMDWMVSSWTEDLNQYVAEITAPVDTIVLGRKLAEGFIPYWAQVAANPNDAEFTAGRFFTETRKVVFTKTLDRSPWDQTILANGGLSDEITELKKQEGGDLIAYGGAAFVSALIKERLIDEFHLLINPTAIGSGMSIFKELDSRLNLSLQRSVSFDCGVIVLHYVPSNSSVSLPKD